VHIVVVGRDPASTSFHPTHSLTVLSPSAIIERRLSLVLSTIRDGVVAVLISVIAVLIIGACLMVKRGTVVVRIVRGSLSIHGGTSRLALRMSRCCSCGNLASSCLP